MQRDRRYDPKTSSRRKSSRKYERKIVRVLLSRAYSGARERVRRAAPRIASPLRIGAYCERTRPLAGYRRSFFSCFQHLKESCIGLCMHQQSGIVLFRFGREQEFRENKFSEARRVANRCAATGSTPISGFSGNRCRKAERRRRPSSLFCARRSFSDVLNEIRLSSSQVKISRQERAASMAKVRLNLNFLMICAYPLTEPPKARYHSISCLP